MTKLCLKGAKYIWMQCDSSLYEEGEDSMKQAFLYGDKDSKYYLGLLYSGTGGPFPYHEEKAKRYFMDGAKDGNPMTLVGAACCGFYDNAFDAESGMNLTTALIRVRMLAQGGDVFAAWQMARYLEHIGSQDKAEIIGYYEQAADGGIVEALVHLGQCYEGSELTGRSLEKAMEFAERAAGLGNVWGLKKLGMKYRLEGDEETALQYLRAAALQGDAEAPMMVAKMYLAGVGSDSRADGSGAGGNGMGSNAVGSNAAGGNGRDKASAIRFLEMAADQGDTRSYLELGELFYRDQYIEKDNERALFWYQKAYETEDLRAAGPYGRLLMLPGAKQNQELGRKLLRLAAENREYDPNGEACLLLGNTIQDEKNETGDGGSVSFLREEAIYWYEMGGRRGNPECMEILGNLFFRGEEGADADYEKAFYWFSKCEENGTLQSPACLGRLYLKGEGCEENEQKAIELFERAIEEQQDSGALYELGFVYEMKGGRENLEKAKTYYDEAAELGNEDADRRRQHFKRTFFGGWKVVQ